MAAAANDGATVATDVAEQLVRDGVAFREAHRRVAERVAAGERFTSPTAAEAAAVRQPLAALAEQIARARAALG
jgi:argininosuccinate lyase